MAIYNRCYNRSCLANQSGLLHSRDRFPFALCLLKRSDVITFQPEPNLPWRVHWRAVSRQTWYLPCQVYNITNWNILMAFFFFFFSNLFLVWVPNLVPWERGCWIPVLHSNIHSRSESLFNHVALCAPITAFIWACSSQSAFAHTQKDPHLEMCLEMLYFLSRTESRWKWSTWILDIPPS